MFMGMTTGKTTLSSSTGKRLQKALRAAEDLVVETLWPTRCAVCDRPGDLLCDVCAEQLMIIDTWRACPRCGAPFGALQCTECNDVVLASIKREEPSYDGLASALVFDERSGAIVIAYKDQGERRLADIMAAYMTPYIAPSWRASSPIITHIPATNDALRRRGFDHTELLAQQIAHLAKLPHHTLFLRPQTHDQRKLSRRGRLQNMADTFTLIEGAPLNSTVIVVDDVCTTGATLMSAADALKEGGYANVYGLTFARV